LPRKKALRPGAINDRALHFLKLLVERYIQEGHPVGSRTLAKDAGLDLSPATIRNVMADLEEMGFVASPHASAGRVPTVSGFRLFVDCLITLRPLEKREVESIRAQLGISEEPSRLIHLTSQLLSGITNMAGVVRLPRRDRASFQRIDFIRLSGDRVLTVLVTDDDEVHNRIIHTSRVYSPAELDQAANYLNGKFSGRGMAAVRAELVQEMREARERMDQIMTRALEMAGQVVEDTDADDDYLIAGQTNLMGVDDLASMDRLKQLFEAFTEKQQVLHLLDRCMEADGVQIFIGEESGYKMLDGCSLVTAPYTSDGRVVGVLGVIGPTRMDYERVIPIVDATARVLGAALKHR
jgi:heat-inducible transcriptional repressor